MCHQVIKYFCFFLENSFIATTQINRYKDWNCESTQKYAMWILLSSSQVFFYHLQLFSSINTWRKVLFIVWKFSLSHTIFFSSLTHSLCDDDDDDDESTKRKIGKIMKIIIFYSRKPFVLMLCEHDKYIECMSDDMNT